MIVTDDIAPRSDRILLPRTATAAIAATFLLMGVLVSAYGPLLGLLTHRYGVSLSVAGTVLSAHFAGALLGVVLSMRGLERTSIRAFVSAALAALGLGCAGVALAPSWPLFLAGVFVIGVGFGALDLGLNSLVAHSEGTRRAALLNALNGAFGLGAVAGPILVSALSGQNLSLLYVCCAALALGMVPVANGIAGRLPAASRAPGGGRRTLVWIFAAAFVLYVATEVGTGGWMTSHLESLGIQSVAAATLTSGFWLALALGRLLVALVPARVPEAAIVIACSAAGALALSAALIGAAAPIAYIVAGFAIAPIFPTGIVWLAKLLPGDARATSWLFPAAMVGGAFGPGAIGAVVALYGIDRAPAVLLAVAIGTFAVFSVAARVSRRAT
jgi:fucose permease